MKLRLTVDVSIGKVELMAHRNVEGKEKVKEEVKLEEPTLRPDAESEEGEGQADGEEILELLGFIVDSLRGIARKNSAGD